MKILNTDDLLEIATEEALPMQDEVENVIKAVDKLAARIAEHYDIVKGETSWEGKPMAGLCTSFRPKHPKQECPQPIEIGDVGGEWE